MYLSCECIGPGGQVQVTKTKFKVPMVVPSLHSQIHPPLFQDHNLEVTDQGSLIKCSHAQLPILCIEHNPV